MLNRNGCGVRHTYFSAVLGQQATGASSRKYLEATHQADKIHYSAVNAIEITHSLT